MTHPTRNRSRLMVGCGGAALALALALSPGQATAQGIRADGNFVFGNGQIVITGPTSTRVDLFTPTVVIDWDPNEDVNGDAFAFIGTGSSAEFRNTQSPNFAVLNRILPSTNNNVMTIDGSVISRFLDVNGASIPAGTVAFYSPTGILIGGNASFDVGSLLLTTLDTSNTDFENFAQSGGFMNLAAATPGSTARIEIAPGAQILASPENAFFAVVAADVQMRGTALVNGSHAYVAGEVVNLSFSNGLFNISVPVGTAASGNVMRVDGTVGGPSSTGVTGDNHMIYGVAHAQNDPISMLFSGNLGFDPAQSAGIVNGEIILAANYDVFGRFVAGGNIDAGINATFRQTDGTSNVRANIFVRDFTASSAMLAIGTHGVQAEALNAASTIAGNLLLVGRQNSRIVASNGQTMTITGDVLVDSRDYGAVSSSLQSLDQINAEGGIADIIGLGGTVTINGNALVTADAFGGADDISGIAGSALGGTAAVFALGGNVGITGDTTISARGVGPGVDNILQGAEARGGRAAAYVFQAGAISFGQNLTILADAIAANGSVFASSTVSDAFGGTAILYTEANGGTASVGGSVSIDASAVGGSSNNAGAGSVGDAGEATLQSFIAGQITILGDVNVTANGTGGNNSGGIGGAGLGGRASVLTRDGSTIGITGSFNAEATGRGGNGRNGGDGSGGIAGLEAITGQITIGAGAFAGAAGFGGNASFDFGGNGGIGRGGNSALLATGSLTETATVTITGDATAFAQGTGGRGGASDGMAIAAGRGGDGIGGQFAVPNQADPAFGSGAYILAGGDNGRITVSGDAAADAQGFGGSGGDGGSIVDGGRGGDAFGGSAQVGLDLFGLDGSVGLGTASLGNVSVRAGALGGSGGLSGADFATGNGGDATGGSASLTVQAGAMTAAEIVLNANGAGGEGRLGGLGQGGSSLMLGGLGGSLTAGLTFIRAQGFGGFSGDGTGGDGIGGTAGINGDGISVTLGDLASIDASGFGGGADAGASGNGTGGEAYIAFTPAGAPGTITVTGHTQVFANGEGGTTNGAFAAGDGAGGLARIAAQGGGTITLGSAQVTAIGLGGFANSHEGGNGTGGIVRLRAAGAGSALTIQRNVPNDQTETLGNTFMLNADGVGEDARGGSGTGGNGRGGTLELLVNAGASMTLPTNIAADPDAAAPRLLFAARGLGGASDVNGGIGGEGRGGEGTIEVDGAGSDLIMGETVFTVLGEGGSSAQSTINVTGGAGIGGVRRIRVLNGGEATLHLPGVIADGISGVSGGIGGSGSGTGNGGAGFGGRNSLELIGGALNVTGELALIDGTTGGDGVIGGDALASGEGGSLALTATNSTINLLPSGSSLGRILIGGTTQGGTGSAAGGFARSPNVVVNLTDTNVNGGAIEIATIASGGAATNPDGIGGNALSGTVAVNLTGSNLGLVGETVVSATAIGGAGGFGGQGGSASSSAVDVVVNNGTITLQTNQVGVPGALRVLSNAFGGLGSTVGNATSARAALNLSAVSLTANAITVSSEAFAGGQSGQNGGIASGGEARLAISQGGILNAGVIEVLANAFTSTGGSSQAGGAMFDLAAGSTATVNANALRLLANGSGADLADLDNGAGMFAAFVGGGNVNLGSFEASALGDLIPPDQAASTLAAIGGNLNVSGTLNAAALGDIVISTEQGGIIGSAASISTNTAITIETRGNIAVDDDDSGQVGLGGQSISLAAGGSIQIGGNMATATGPISIIANNGSAFPLPTGVTSTAAITMTAGTSINAGTGTVTIHLGNGGGVAGRLSGAITLANISAGQINVRNFGTGSGTDIVVLGSGVLTASGGGQAIDLAALDGEVNNLNGDAGLILTGGGHYGIFAATPTGSQIGSFANYARRYNVANAAAYDALNPGGNFAAFRIVPVLTVTADDISRFYGNVTPGLTASFSGFLPGDSIADLLGAPELTTLANGTSGVGLYAITAMLGTLISQQGYQFNFVDGQLTVVPRPITITADSLAKLAGRPDPLLTFTVGGAGLVNNDQLTGSLVRDAGEALRSFAIRIGSLAAGPNYLITFVPGQLTINPPPAPPEINNPISLTPVINPGDPTPTATDEEEARFGIDFPAQPDAPLIEEEVLVDDPVTSGGDPTLYSSGVTTPAGGQ